MAIDVSQMALAQRLKETVSVTRVDLDNDPTGNTTVSVAVAVEVVIAPATAQGDRVEGTGLVTIQGYYQGLMLTPNANIQVGDIFTRGASLTPNVLYVADEPFSVAGVQWMNLRTTRQTRA